MIALSRFLAAIIFEGKKDEVPSSASSAVTVDCMETSERVLRSTDGETSLTPVLLSSRFFIEFLNHVAFVLLQIRCHNHNHNSHSELID